MHDVDWRRLRTFQIVADLCSFTKAGRELGLTQSAVSRQIAALEQDLGTSLFIRSGSGLVLTDKGEYFSLSVREMSKHLALGLSRLNELKAKPEGPLRITTTVGFGSAWLTGRINRFHSLYPDIQVSLLLTDNVDLDISNRQADCAIRFQPPTDLNLVRKQIATFSYKIFSSKRYLSKRSAPKTLDDLADHDLIVYGSEVGGPPIERINWILGEGMPEGTKRVPALRVNSVYGIYRAVESGMGIAALPFYMSERSDDLVELFPEVEGPTIPVYFVYPEELIPSRRIEAVRDFLIEEIKASWATKEKRQREQASLSQQHATEE